MIRASLTLALLTGFVALTARADDKPKAQAPGFDGKAMEAMMKHATPGPAHKLLDPMIGSWTYTGKIWMVPGTPPVEMSGTAERKWILGGRFMQEEFKGVFLGQPFEGFSLTGYDNEKKKYVSYWADNMTTSFSRSEGTTTDDGKTLHFQREGFEPSKGRTEKGHDIIKILDQDHNETEMYGVEDGKETKMMHIVFTRKK